MKRTTSLSSVLLVLIMLAPTTLGLSLASVPPTTGVVSEECTGAKADASAITTGSGDAVRFDFSAPWVLRSAPSDGSTDATPCGGITGTCDIKVYTEGKTTTVEAWFGFVIRFFLNIQETEQKSSIHCEGSYDMPVFHYGGTGLRQAHSVARKVESSTGTQTLFEVQALQEKDEVTTCSYVKLTDASGCLTHHEGHWSYSETDVDGIILGIDACMDIDVWNQEGPVLNLLEETQTISACAKPGAIVYRQV